MDYTILLIDDEVEMCVSLAAVLKSNGYTSLFTTNPLDAMKIVAARRIDLVIMDVKMPEMSGMDLLNVLKDHYPALNVIMITGYPTVDNAVRAMKYGALNFYVKPLNLPELLQEIQGLAAQISRPSILPQATLSTIVTRNPVMGEILATLRQAAATAAPVLLTGESGTGKELVASALHQMSPRVQQPFIKVNCAALPEELMESELFGHERGAFTGAVKERKGRFELAHTGTIFLDEIGDISLKTQAKLLRVIQEHEFERVGGTKTLKTDLRLVTATNKDFETLIQQGAFRADLYYRLSVIAIHLPPLRERPDDILLLVEYFITHYNQVYQKHIQGISEEVRWFFRHHTWPGNIRELKNCIERAVIFCQQASIGVEHLAAQYKKLIDQPAIDDYAAAQESLNREIILDALHKSKGIKKKAADLLDIDRRTLYNRMKKLGLE